MAKSRPLLERLLNTPDLARIVPHLPPEHLHRVIQIGGLEDCAELVALATPGQISRIMDVDLWRVRTRGGDEGFDAARFGLWLEVLMQSGSAVAAEKLSGLDLELVTVGLTRLCAVFHGAAVSSFTTIDGEPATVPESTADLECEIGGYVITSRHRATWDALVELLMFLASERHDYFHRLMHACVRLSDGAREPDGFHSLLDDDEQALFDLGSEREARRETQGYVTAAQARAFLQAGRELRLDIDPPGRSSIAQAYFRAIGSASPPEPGARPESAGTPSDASFPVAPDIDPHAVARVIGALRDAGVVAAAPRGLLSAPGVESSHVARIKEYVETHPASVEELAFLANALIAGCSIQDRAFTAQEASDAVAAVCNLGLENWPPRWPDRDLVTAFQVGWTVLHHEICIFTAERLVEVAAGIRSRDRDVQLRLNGLRTELTRHLGDRAPWRARNALDVVLMLDAPSWAALCALIDECPVMHAAVGSVQRRSRTINPGEFEFIARNSQIAAVREFLDSLPSSLTR